jgi:myo-inositol-1(or 4)-monophosphatase
MTYIDIANNIVVALSMAAKQMKTDFEIAQKLGLISIDNKESKNFLPDFVTNADKESEKIIREFLSGTLPDIPFVGEECGGDLEQSKFFLVDPLDGTSNFVALRDYFSICAAYVEDGDVKAAVIADPMRGFLLKASKGAGVTKIDFNSSLDETPIPRLSEDDVDIRQFQLECELAMNTPENFSILEKLFPKMSGMRKSGSTALDMANIAMGRKIVLVSDGLEPHDLAAGLLIVRESGGIVTDLHGQNASIKSSSILAGSVDAHGKILALLNKAPLI